MGFPLPPNNGSWQRDLRVAAADGASTARSGCSNTGATSNNVFQFVRVEDIAYDKRPGMENVVYIVDSGRGRTAASTLDTPTSGPPTAGSGRWCSTPPTRRSRHLAHGVRRGRRQPREDAERDTPARQHRDDAERTAAHRGPGLEPAVPGRLHRSRTPPPRGSGSCRSPARPRSWRRSTSPPTAGRPTSTDEPRATRAPGRRSGIVDASAAFGPGAFLINVQAHTLWVEKAPGDDNNGDGQPDFTYKREGGQPALLHIPGA